jgi:hypothetical protein
MTSVIVPAPGASHPATGRTRLFAPAVLPQRSGDGVGRKPAPQQVLKDSASRLRVRAGRHPLAQQHAGDPFSFILRGHLADELLCEIPIDAAGSELERDAAAPASFHASCRPDVRGAHAPIVQRAIRNERVDQIVRLARVVLFGEKPLAELGAGVITPAEEPQGSGADGCRLGPLYAFRKTTSGVFSRRLPGISTGVSQPCRSGVAPLT